jgi:hypothetical protein
MLGHLFQKPTAASGLRHGRDLEEGLVVGQDLDIDIRVYRNSGYPVGVRVDVARIAADRGARSDTRAPDVLSFPLRMDAFDVCAL